LRTDGAEGTALTPNSMSIVSWSFIFLRFEALLADAFVKLVFLMGLLSESEN
jgi:hypothetical protein